MAETERDVQREQVRGVINKLQSGPRRLLLRYFAPQLAAHDPQLLQDLVFDEAARRLRDGPDQPPMTCLTDVLAELGLRLTVVVPPADACTPGE